MIIKTKKLHLHRVGPSDLPDDVLLSEVDPSWSREELLEKQGIFPLADIADKLHVSSAILKKRATDLSDAGHSPWEVMGLRRVLTQWVVLMKRFGRYLGENMGNGVREVLPEWDGNQMLAQKGKFYLVDVCEKIPFKPNQIRYQARRQANPKETVGVWKDPESKTYLVEMEVFSRWILSLWDPSQWP